MITAQEGLPQQRLRQETALRDVDQDTGEVLKVALLAFNKVRTVLIVAVEIMDHAVLHLHLADVTINTILRFVNGVYIIFHV